VVSIRLAEGKHWRVRVKVCHWQVADVDRQLNTQLRQPPCYSDQKVFHSVASSHKLASRRSIHTPVDDGIVHHPRECHRRDEAVAVNAVVEAGKILINPIRVAALEAGAAICRTLVTTVRGVSPVRLNDAQRIRAPMRWVWTK
jgi:hypothetical protein